MGTSSVLYSIAEEIESLPETFDTDSFHSSKDEALDICNFLGLSKMPHSSSFEELTEGMYNEEHQVCSPLFHASRTLDPDLEDWWYSDAEDSVTDDLVAEDSALGTSSVLYSIAEKQSQTSRGQRIAY